MNKIIRSIAAVVIASIGLGGCYIETKEEIYSPSWGTYFPLAGSKYECVDTENPGMFAYVIKEESSSDSGQYRYVVTREGNEPETYAVRRIDEKNFIFVRKVNDSFRHFPVRLMNSSKWFTITQYTDESVKKVMEKHGVTTKSSVINHDLSGSIADMRAGMQELVTSSETAHALRLCRVAS